MVGKKPSKDTPHDMANPPESPALNHARAHGFSEQVASLGEVGGLLPTRGEYRCSAVPIRSWSTSGGFHRAAHPDRIHRSIEAAPMSDIRPAPPADQNPRDALR
jgi:hypothetical protein